MTFTANEIRALQALYNNCLDGMGGSSWEDLESDPYTWCYADTLIAKGWTKNEAAGTFSSLAEKGAISEADKNEWALNLTPAVREAVTATVTAKTVNQETTKMSNIETAAAKLEIHAKSVRKHLRSLGYSRVNYPTMKAQQIVKVIKNKVAA